MKKLEKCKVSSQQLNEISFAICNVARSSYDLITVNLFNKFSKLILLHNTVKPYALKTRIRAAFCMALNWSGKMEIVDNWIVTVQEGSFWHEVNGNFRQKCIRFFYAGIAPIAYSEPYKRVIQGTFGYIKKINVNRVLNPLPKLEPPCQDVSVWIPYERIETFYNFIRDGLRRILTSNDLMFPFFFMDKL